MILDASFSGTDENHQIDHISIDSRSLQNGLGTLFFALSGRNNDAHKFIPELISKGVKNFVVTQVPASLKNRANFFVVNNTLDALQDFAVHHRSNFEFPVIGITGSNGKTIVKEWLNFLLSPDHNIIKSPKSYNSQVGVPLSIVGINEKHDLGIFEAGISTRGEMERLESMISPTIGILTNIGTAHDEGFRDRTEKIAEKIKLFANSEILILQKNAELDPLLKGIKTFSWSFDDTEANVLITTTRVENGTQFQASSQSATVVAEVPFHDYASVENAASCLATMIWMQCDPMVIQNRMPQLYPVEMRLKVKNGIHGTTIIDDSYSSDFQSLRIALDFLESQKHHLKKTLIISDIIQSGLSEKELYKKVSQMIKSNKITRLIAIGETIAKHQASFDNSTVYKTTDEFIASINDVDFSDETILVKGARSFSFERIVKLLEEKTHETVLEINLNALSHNLNFYKSKLKRETKIMVMVKAFGYGNGGFEIAKSLEHHHIDYLGVAFADEGISLKNSGIRVPIMVLNPETTSFASIIQYGLEPEIYSLKGLKAFIRTAKEKEITDYPIHIKLDTGMHRLGFEEESVDELVQILQNSKWVSVKSILSHLATSDELIHQKFALRQIERFEKMSADLMSRLNINPIRHILNTSGISNYPQAQYDMVRLGIGIYGVSNDPSEQKNLENVGTLKSVISQLRMIRPDESVGYGRKFVAKGSTQIATIPIGYADGIPRHWGNGIGWVTINGSRAPIVGSICMDMLMADCSGIGCSEGETVIIFGENPTVSQIAEKVGTIAYEILTGISQRVKRVFYRE